ncbi:hypothetical protein HAL1_06155 [Halomonas sp. HAL1]|nr:hypothetical protein HAL1_06155 [Halomonas sp. HAL1]
MNNRISGGISARVQRVTQTVTNEIEAGHCHGDGNARNNR